MRIERQHDLAALLVRRAAAHHAGVAALRHDRDLLRDAEFYDGATSSVVAGRTTASAAPR
jgi:hypothetical protein